MHTVLSAISPGQRARVLYLTGKGSIRSRLQDIGAVEGAEIDCIMKSPLGDPTAYLIKGAVIALRAEDAETISVEVTDI